jgi:hypothetical protein
MIFHDSTGDADIQAARRQIQADARTVIAALLKAQPDLSIPKDELEPLAELLRSAMAGLALWSLEHPQIPRPLLVDLVIGAFRGLLQTAPLNRSTSTLAKRQSREPTPTRPATVRARGRHLGGPQRVRGTRAIRRRPAAIGGVNAPLSGLR